MNQFPSVFESISDLNKEQIDALLSLSKKLKWRLLDMSFAPFETFTKYTICTSFLENSTRTKTSFAIAAKKLGATYLDFNTEKSSLQKGESIEETLLTLFAQGVDLCILRTNQSHILSSFKEAPPLKIVNGGDGTNQHPTQALLDLFTMMEQGFDLKGKNISIIGDCIHSRVGHSLCELLPLFGATVTLCGPENFVPSDINLPGVEISHDFEATVKNSDLVYLLRIQKERHSSEVQNLSDEQYHQQWGLNLEKLNAWNKHIPIYHPGPANVGVEISHDLMKSKYYLGYEQVRNSIFVRMAIIQSILQNGDKNIGTDTYNVQ